MAFSDVPLECRRFRVDFTEFLPRPALQAPARDRHGMPGDETGGVVEEARDGAGDLLHAAVAAQRHRADHLLGHDRRVDRTFLRRSSKLARP